MRVAVTCSGYGLISRGVETFLHDLMHRLREMRPDWLFDVYTRAASGHEDEGIRLIHVPAISRDSHWATLYAQIGHRLGFYLRTRNQAEGLSFAIAVTPKLLGRKYDLIFNQAGPFTGKMLAVNRRLGGPPFAHKTASGYSPLELIMKRQRPDLMIATSPFVENWLRSEPPDTPVVCIPNPVDCSLFKPGHGDTPVELRDLERPIVLSVGAMDPMKRPRLLLDAVSRLKRGSLALIGSGILSEEIAKAGAEMLGASRFRLISRAPHEDLPAYYHSADVFTLASEEPFGIVFLEALACNVPVVTHDSPVQKWIAGGAGMTCNCEDADEYAAVLRKALDTDFGNRPRIRAEDFDWKIVAKEYEKAFLSVVEGIERTERIEGKAAINSVGRSK